MTFAHDYDNKFNHIKSRSHAIKTILKPLLALLRKKKPVLAQPEQQCQECADNAANEQLESRLLREMDHASPDAGYIVCDEDDSWRFMPVTNPRYVPVHFARTEAGTFFWTSADSDLVGSRHCYTECQDAAGQSPYLHDRWVQA